MRNWLFGILLGGVSLAAACSSSAVSPEPGGSSGAPDAGPDAAEPDASMDMDAGTGGTGGAGGGMDGGSPAVDSLGSNRDRLLGTYFDWLKATAPTPQSNGLSGSSLGDVCDLWSKLDPSARAVFLTLTARMQGSLLGADNSSMLWHVTKLYRISGGQDATPTDPGSCGGGEYNRMIMSMDATLHAAQVDAAAHQGKAQANGKPDIADIPSGGFWRDSHDLAGPHDPFDATNETEDGAPRGQTQYFKDPSSAAANTPLGRMDLTTLVDPYALEFDQDYDCVHASNPLCTYITYGNLCLPMSSLLGTELFTKNYGDFDEGWKPSGC